MDEPYSSFAEYYEENKETINRKRRIRYHTNKAYRARILSRQRAYDRRRAALHAEVYELIKSDLDLPAGAIETTEAVPQGSETQGNKNIPRKRGRPRKYPRSEDFCNKSSDSDS